VYVWRSGRGYVIQRDSRLPRGRPAAGLVFKDEAIEGGFDDSLFVGVELADGFELEAELVARAALGLIKEEIVGRHAERDGETLDGLERRLAGADLVAVDLNGMDARELAQGLLGQAGWFRLPGNLSWPSALQSIFPCRRRLGRALGTPGKSREFAQLVGMTD